MKDKSAYVKVHWLILVNKAWTQALISFLAFYNLIWTGSK
jgi:hypothetical protein